MTAIFENTAKYHAYKAVVLDKIAPVAMDMDDAYQDAILYMLENPGKEKAYYEAVLPFRLRDSADKLWVRPSRVSALYHRKKGAPLDYGETSLEVLATNKGQPWEEWLGNVKEEECLEINFFSLTLTEATECLTDIRSQMKNPNDHGISFAKTRNKWHLECKVQKHKQFIGQYINIDEARQAKQKFLGDLMDAILDAVDNED